MAIAYTRACAVVLSLLAMPVFTSMGIAASSLDSIDQLVARKALTVSILHGEAKDSLINAAQDRSFPDYFNSDSHRHRYVHKQRIHALSLNVQSRLDVEVICLIDPNGHEISRIVRNRIAHDLSTREAGAVFFAPGFAENPRQVHVSDIYMSSDVQRWVVAYATPVVVNNEKQAILHYEHGLDRFQRAIAEDLSTDSRRYIVAVNRDGYVVADSRTDISIESQGGSAQMQDYFPRFSFAGRDPEQLAAAIDARQQLRDERGRNVSAAYRRTENWLIFGFEPG